MASEREHITECRSEIAQVVLQELEQRGHCTMEELIHNLPDYSWNQVFTAVDRLSRDGTLMVQYSSRVDLYLLSAAQAKTGSPQLAAPHEQAGSSL
ncbi:MAG: hypothetical protein E6K63_04030 [Nitrospirae bacterium]|nr:MAG: hypothetical protein E6K63_04030 [Nitrospirota bacterium]